MKFLSVCLSFLFPLLSISQTNFNLLGQKTYSNDLSDIWGYADGHGNEYALVGVYSGVSIVNVTNPDSLVEVAFITGPNSFWRDIKTWGHHAYVTNETSGGLLIIDLSNLPDSVNTGNWTGGSLGLSTAHNIFIDENGIGYIAGGNQSAGNGVIFIDVNSNPANPAFLGKYTLRYVHDLFVRGDTMWTAEINSGIFSVVDVSDKSSPVVMAANATPSNFTHNVWLSKDGKTLLTTDERSNAPVGAFDVSDLGNISFLSSYLSNPSSGVTPHNVFYVDENFAIIAYYRDGVILLDATYPGNLVEVGRFDTSPFSGSGFNGAWGVYPYLPSGKVLATDIEEGLFVLGVNYVQACHLKGTITNTNTGMLLNNVNVQILSSAVNTSSDLTGQYQIGIPDSGTYNVRFSLNGFVTHTEENVVLESGILKTLHVQLIPSVNTMLSGYILDSISGLGIPGAKILFRSTENTYSGTTDSNGAFTINPIETGLYEAFTGSWGHITKFQSIIITSTGNMNFYLDRGYYDDFLFDLGWHVSGDATTGMWERGNPVGTEFQGNPSNPGSDVPTDFGESCYVTGNGGGQAGHDDVDDGTTLLSSPVFNLADYYDPYVSYYTWFFNEGGNPPPNDALVIWLSNGQDTVVIETIDNSTSSWVKSTIRVIDFIDKTTTMQISFETSDLPGSGHIVEAGVDVFQVMDSVCFTQVIPINSGWNLISSYINPYESAMESIFSEIATDIILVKNNGGQAYIPSLGINEINGWEIEQGYKLKAGISTSLELGCNIADPFTTAISLPVGWSTISYLRTTGMDVVTALSGIADSLLLIKDNPGASYIPAFGINTLGNLQPGQGYKVKMFHPATLIYPDNEFKTYGFDGIYRQSKEPVHFTREKNTGHNATVIIPMESIKDLVTGDEIGIFNSQEKLAGSAVFEGRHLAVTVWGNDPYAKETDGLAYDDKFIYRVWNKNESNEYTAQAVYESGDGLYRNDGVFILKSLDRIQLKQDALLNIYPNPFENNVHIQLTSSDESPKELYLHDNTGKLLSAHLIHQDKQVTLGDNLSPGIYFISLKSTGNRSFFYKVIKLK